MGQFHKSGYGECIHCKDEDVRLFSTRRLCIECYLDKGIRESYPIVVYGQDRWVQDSTKAPVKMPRPTSAPPGSKEKVRVLAERAARGEYLWHPDDADMTCAKPDDFDDVQEMTA